MLHDIILLNLVGMPCNIIFCLAFLVYSWYFSWSQMYFGIFKKVGHLKRKPKLGSGTIYYLFKPIVKISVTFSALPYILTPFSDIADTTPESPTWNRKRY